MFRLVGYHLPISVLGSMQGAEDVNKLFNDSETEKLQGFEKRLYLRIKDGIQRQEFSTIAVKYVEGSIY